MISAVIPRLSDMETRGGTGLLLRPATRPRDGLPDTADHPSAGRAGFRRGYIAFCCVRLLRDHLSLLDLDPQGLRIASMDWISGVGELSRLGLSVYAMTASNLRKHRDIRHTLPRARLRLHRSPGKWGPVCSAPP